MSRLPLKTITIKKLFALSGNICAHPNCNEHIVDSSGNVLREICHIEAAEEGGERYNKASNDEDRRSYENLILMCSKHHKITNDVKKYSTKILKQRVVRLELGDKDKKGGCAIRCKAVY